MTSKTNKPQNTRTTPGCGKPGHDEGQFDYKGKKRCRQCRLESMRRSNGALRLRRRRQALEAYGGKCACCGVSEEVFLVIGHVDGYESTRKTELGLKSSSSALYHWLEKQNYPEGFQVLCANCNTARTKGVCPHQEGQQ